jgi:hypothetical protein
VLARGVFALLQALSSIHDNGVERGSAATVDAALSAS